MRAEGRLPPLFRELDNAKKNKNRRILTMTPFFSEARIRFPIFTTVKTPDGRIWEPVGHPNEGHIHSLLGQVQEFTDEGIRGHDDLIDCLEMAIRVWGGHVPLIEQEEEKHPTNEMLDKWKDVGLDFKKEQVPQPMWTDEMYEESLGTPIDTGGVLPYV